MLQHRRYKRVLGLAVCAIVLALPTLGICIGPPRDSFGLMPFIDEQAMRDYATSGSRTRNSPSSLAPPLQKGADTTGRLRAPV
jgi:hypothetical protein